MCIYISCIDHIKLSLCGRGIRVESGMKTVEEKGLVCSD